MDPGIHLAIHNTFSIVSAIILTGSSFFIYLNGKRNATNIATALALMMAVVFYVSNAIGVSISDPTLSRYVFMFNLCMFPAGAFQLHALLSMVGKADRKKAMIIFVYAAAAFCVTFFLIFPDLFLLPSVPKMYFPNYYNPGLLNWIRIAFLEIAVLLYSLYLLWDARQKASSPVEKNRFTYFFWAFVFIYLIIFIPNLLVYNIPVDPLWGAFAGIGFAIPFGYAAVRYELFNIKVVAKQAFLYSLAVGVVGGIIVIFDYFNYLLTRLYPDFPFWTTSIVSAVLVVTISMLIWRYMRETDILKYEFITTVTHKFRTPLTHIKWAAENLEKASSPEDIKEQLGYIQSANAKLVELTDVITNASNADTDYYQYRMGRIDLSALVEEILASLHDHIAARKMSFKSDIMPGLFVLGDLSRLRFVIQTLIENAINYTADGGTITISARSDKDTAICEVRDSGIGIAKEELPLLFSKFYRGKQARSADTEGMGIGLFISKQIIERHRGKIWASSDGPGLGSAFSFSLPIVS
ncbi:MAG: HAMP domain-containing histidine kinase [Patescibacteria group bacterium]|nr:HAMP domain-containing histidine kinase [Patescibacteria group bacterium]